MRFKQSLLKKKGVYKLIRQVVFGFIFEAENRTTRAIELLQTVVISSITGLIEAVNSLVTTVLNVFFEDIIIKAVQIVFDSARAIATAALGGEEDNAFTTILDDEE